MPSVLVVAAFGPIIGVFVTSLMIVMVRHVLLDPIVRLRRHIISPMSDLRSLADARSVLDECEAVVGRLHKMCCEPDRSPRMRAIEDSLAAVRREINSGEPESLDRALGRLEDVGSRLGSLQVGCCAPVRMPLYAEALEHLNRIQLAVNAGLGSSH